MNRVTIANNLKAADSTLESKPSTLDISHVQLVNGTQIKMQQMLMNAMTVLQVIIAQKALTKSHCVQVVTSAEVKQETMKTTLVQRANTQ